jgi:hypothetical protein
LSFSILSNTIVHTRESRCCIYKMKLSALLAIVFAGSSLAAFGWSSSSEQLPLADDLNVPGKNPLLFCEDPAKDILIIKNVDLDPNPPKA